MWGTRTHQCRRAHKCSPNSLTHHPKVNLLQALRTRVYKRGSKGRVVSLDHQVTTEGPGAWGSIGAIGQLKVRDRVTDVQSVVWIKRDRWDLKILVPETGGMEGLSKVKERNRITTWRQKKSGVSTRVKAAVWNYSPQTTRTDGGPVRWCWDNCRFPLKTEKAC